MEIWKWHKRTIVRHIQMSRININGALVAITSPPVLINTSVAQFVTYLAAKGNGGCKDVQDNAIVD